MPTIDFFEERNKQTTNKKEFGLCDDGNEKRAYIDEDLANKNIKWCGIVKNDNEKEILFYPIDNCVDLIKENGKMASRCDGVLRYEDKKLVFTEIKDRKVNSDAWRDKGAEQIITTLEFFFETYERNAFNIEAWICNRQITNQSYFGKIKSFAKKTKELFGFDNGIVLTIQREKII